MSAVYPKIRNRPPLLNSAVRLIIWAFSMGLLIAFIDSKVDLPQDVGTVPITYLAGG